MDQYKYILLEGMGQWGESGVAAREENGTAHWSFTYRKGQGGVSSETR